MKWYFASNNQSPGYEYLIKAAVESAIKNTALEPHFIYDGTPDALTVWLESKGVKVIYHRVSFYNHLQDFYSPKNLNTAGGAFLRCDIPLLETEEEIILYTDCDVLFLQPIKPADFPSAPYFACTTESWKDDWSVLNTGVMLMNLPNLRRTHSEFITYITSNLPKLDVFDQSAYNLFYADRYTKLPLEYNWKSYWGKNPKTKIVHFHGPKPYDLLHIFQHKPVREIYEGLVRFDRLSCIYYLSEFCRYSDVLSLTPQDAYLIGLEYLSGKLVESEASAAAPPPQKTRSWKRSLRKLKKTFQKKISRQPANP